MRKRTYLWIVIAGLLVLAACSPVGIKPTDGPKQPPAATQPAPNGGLQPRPPFLDRLREEIAKKQGVPADQVIVEEYQSAQWPNSCLGLPQQGEVCAQTITPGYLVVLSLPSGMIELHTNSDGSTYRQTSLESPPGERPVALIWQRSGGFAGICERLFVYLDGSYRLMDCVKEQVLGEGSLPQEDQDHLRQLQGQYTDFRWQLVPPANSADMFTEELSFNGSGNTNMPEKDQQQLAEYVAQLVGKLRSPAPKAT